MRSDAEGQRRRETTNARERLFCTAVGKDDLEILGFWICLDSKLLHGDLDDRLEAVDSGLKESDC